LSVINPFKPEFHSSPSSAEMKNGGGIPPLPHTSSWGSAQLITHRDNLAFKYEPESESELLYDWWFTANHFVLATSPLRLTIPVILFSN
jgi:hypothetical protein